VRAVRISGVLVWTVVLWVLLWGDLSAANVLSGLAVGLVVLTVAGSTRDVDPQQRSRLAPLAALHFAGYFLYKLVEANLLLAWEIVTPRNRINTGVVEVPLRTESNLATMIVANVITLTPGSLVLEAIGSPPVLYVNVLHLHDLERVRHDLLRIEALSVRAFGSATARAQLAGGTP
jgi:multicomponent Na+:H+ antiporter subunit E